MKRDRLLTTGIVLFVAGIVGLIAVSVISGPRVRVYGPSGGMMGRWGRYRVPDTFSSNGERIYYTATSERDEITFTGGPMWMRMHGGSCVSCHGPDGKGGITVPMTDETSADIRYSVLTSTMHASHDGDQHPPYTDALIKRAITQGLDPAGHELDSTMPRWRMSDRDLNDLIDYLKTL